MHREIIPSNKYESLFTFLKIKVPKGENVHSDATEKNIFGSTKNLYKEPFVE